MDMDDLVSLQKLPKIGRHSNDTRNSFFLEFSSFFHLLGAQKIHISTFEIQQVGDMQKVGFSAPGWTPLAKH